MRYLTWQLIWENGYGYGPEGKAAENGAHLEASSWVNPSVEEGTILGYLTGDLDISILTPWSIAELSEAGALAFAQGIWPDAYVDGDGVIVGPTSG